MAHLDPQADLLIDRYLRRELTDEEQEQFESLMLSDAEFAEEVGVRRDIVIGIRAAERVIIRKRLAQITLPGVDRPTVELTEAQARQSKDWSYEPGDEWRNSDGSPQSGPGGFVTRHGKLILVVLAVVVALLLAFWLGRELRAADFSQSSSSITRMEEKSNNRACCQTPAL
jgi:hypothetical protein